MEGFSEVWRPSYSRFNSLSISSRRHPRVLAPFSKPDTSARYGLSTCGSRTIPRVIVVLYSLATSPRTSKNLFQLLPRANSMQGRRLRLNPRAGEHQSALPGHPCQESPCWPPIAVARRVTLRQTPCNHAATLFLPSPIPGIPRSNAIRFL